MSMDNKKSPVRVEARTAMQLFSNVMDMVAKGYDICSPMFVANDCSLNLWMVDAYSLYEYYLIEAETLKDLDVKVQRLTEIGYDFMHGIVLHNGTHLQWMQRMHEKSAVSGELAVIGEELSMVEDVRPLGRLVSAPVVSAGFGMFLEKLFEVGS